MAKLKRFFITGTDTEVGKTYVTVALLNALRKKGLRTLALKPIAAGCEMLGDEWVNEDAIQLRQAMTEHLPYQLLNPIALKSAVAPHLAAEQEGRRLSADRLAGMVRGALMTAADVALIEGAGGWLVPLNERETLADLVRMLEVPVILVVGVRLGCLNHALLTVQSISSYGLPIAGWVANCVDANAAMIEENIMTLKARIAAPCLGVIPWQVPAQAEAAADFINIDELLNPSA